MVFKMVLATPVSHPSRMCGLKSDQAVNDELIYWSHPSRMCGLKFPDTRCPRYRPSVTSFTDVWIEMVLGSLANQLLTVTSFTDVWIEIRIPWMYGAKSSSHILHGCVD